MLTSPRTKPIFQSTLQDMFKSYHIDRYTMTPPVDSIELP